MNFTSIFRVFLAFGLLAFGGFIHATLNDTGQDTCFDGTSLVACTEANTGDNAPNPRQDGRYGRDAQARAGQLPKIGGGVAGFDFTALDAKGNPTHPTHRRQLKNWHVFCLLVSSAPSLWRNLAKWIAR